MRRRKRRKDYNDDDSGVTFVDFGQEDYQPTEVTLKA